MTNIHQFISVLFVAMLTACAGNQEDVQREKTYREVQDSLKKYKSEVFELQKDDMNAMLRDYIKLDYKKFTKKHHLGGDQIDQLTKLFVTRYEMGRLLREINVNRTKIELIDSLEQLPMQKKGLHI